MTHGLIRKRKEPSAGKFGQEKPQSVLQKLQKARELYKKGKKATTIAKRTGLELEEVKALIAAMDGVLSRKSHQETLEDLKRRLLGIVPLAEAKAASDPSAYNVSAITNLTSELRGIIEHLTELTKPESAALEMIQGVFQPFIRDVMRDFTVEARRARTRSSAVATDTAAERAITLAFDAMTRDTGVAVAARYAEYTEKLGILLKCDLEELRKLARDSRSEIKDTALVK